MIKDILNVFACVFIPLSNREVGDPTLVPLDRLWHCIKYFQANTKFNTKTSPPSLKSAAVFLA